MLQTAMLQTANRGDSSPDGLDEAALGVLDAQHGGTGRHDVLASHLLAAHGLPFQAGLPHHALCHLHTQHHILHSTWA